MDWRQAPDGSGAGTRFAAWCLLLVLPLWLFAVAVIGYGKDRNCTSRKARGEIPAIRLGRRLVVARRTLQHLLAGQAVTAGDRPAEADPAASAEAS